MNWREWLRTLLGLSVLLGLAEMLLPQGNMAKFSKLVFGLVLILAVLEPVVNLVSLNPITIDASLSGTSFEPEIDSAAARLRTARTKPLLSASSREMEELLLNQVDLVSVQVEGGTGKGGTTVRVLIEPYDGQLENQVKSIVCGLLGLSPNQVEVHELGS